MNTEITEGNKEIVISRYPDAFEMKYSLRSMCIWSKVLNRRLSAFCPTFDEAWEDAAIQIKRKLSSSR